MTITRRLDLDLKKNKLSSPIFIRKEDYLYAPRELSITTEWPKIIAINRKALFEVRGCSLKAFYLKTVKIHRKKIFKSDDVIQFFCIFLVYASAWDISRNAKNSFD